jgi:hypothetical protein
MTDRENLMANDDLSDTLAGALALITVTTKAVEVLIATHPDPQMLHRAWQAQLPESVEDEMETAPFGVEAYRNAFVENLEGISSLIKSRLPR